MAISAPVLPAEMATSASCFFTASIASHIDDFQRPWRSAWLGLGGVAEQDELGVRMALQRGRGAGHDHGGAMVPSHGVERNSDLGRHGWADGSRGGGSVRRDRWAREGRTIACRRIETM